MSKISNECLTYVFLDSENLVRILDFGFVGLFTVSCMYLSYMPVTFVYVSLLSLGAAVSAQALLSCSLLVFLHLLVFLCGTQSLSKMNE